MDFLAGDGFADGKVGRTESPKPLQGNGVFARNNEARLPTCPVVVSHPELHPGPGGVCIHRPLRKKIRQRQHSKDKKEGGPVFSKAAQMRMLPLPHVLTSRLIDVRELLISSPLSQLSSDLRLVLGKIRVA